MTKEKLLVYLSIAGFCFIAVLVNANKFGRVFGKRRMGCFFDWAF